MLHFMISFIAGDSSRRRTSSAIESSALNTSSLALPSHVSTTPMKGTPRPLLGDFAARMVRSTPAAALSSAVWLTLSLTAVTAFS